MNHTEQRQILADSVAKLKARARAVGHAPGGYSSNNSAHVRNPGRLIETDLRSKRNKATCITCEEALALSQSGRRVIDASDFAMSLHKRHGADAIAILSGNAAQFRQELETVKGTPFFCSDVPAELARAIESVLNAETESKTSA